VLLGNGPFILFRLSSKKRKKKAPLSWSPTTMRAKSASPNRSTSSIVTSSKGMDLAFKYSYLGNITFSKGYEKNAGNRTTSKYLKSHTLDKNSHFGNRSSDTEYPKTGGNRLMQGSRHEETGMILKLPNRIRT
jgi:hypothetical protein